MQAVQLEEPAAEEKVPGAQGVQEEAPALEKEPGKQSEQFVALPSKENEPAEQPFKYRRTLSSTVPPQPGSRL